MPISLFTENSSTIVTSDSQVSVLEGGAIDISCNSTGGPIPSITWTINNQNTNFNQSDVVTNPVINTNPVTTTPGYTVSTLHIVNAQYPTHNGMYTCTGTNTISGTQQTSSANITVQIQGKTNLLKWSYTIHSQYNIFVVSPEVEVSANIERVAVGDSVTLTCSVIRGNPMNYVFEWSHEGVSVVTTSTMDSFNNLNYPSIKDNDVGMYTCSVTNGIGSAATSTLNITLGGMYIT